MYTLLHTTVHISEQHRHQSPMNYLQVPQAEAITCCVCVFVREQTRVELADTDLWRETTCVADQEVRMCFREK